MNFRIVTAIAFKLYAFYFLTSILFTGPTFYAIFMRQNSRTMNPMISPSGAILLTIVVVGVAALLFHILWRLGNSVLNNAAELNSEKAMQAHSILKALLMLLGIYYTLSVVINLPIELPRLWYLIKSGSGLEISDYANLASLIIQFLLGISLITKVEGWFSFIQKYLVLNEKS